MPKDLPLSYSIDKVVTDGMNTGKHIDGIVLPSDNTIVIYLTKNGVKTKSSSHKQVPTVKPNDKSNKVQINDSSSMNKKPEISSKDSLNKHGNEIVKENNDALNKRVFSDIKDEKEVKDNTSYNLPATGYGFNKLFASIGAGILTLGTYIMYIIFGRK